MAFKKILVYSDGGARGNPGPAGIGAVIKDGEGNILSTISEYIGETTNNQAEYRALLAAAIKAKEFMPQEIVFYLDSELVVKQMRREYKVKNKELEPHFVRIYNELINIHKTSFVHIRREMNKEADKLVNEALDKYLGKQGTHSSVG